MKFVFFGSRYSILSDQVTVSIIISIGYAFKASRLHVVSDYLNLIRMLRVDWNIGVESLKLPNLKISVLFLLILF